MSNFRDRLRSYKRWFQHQMSGSPLEFEEPTLPLKYIDLSTSIRPFENYLLAICLNGRYWRLKTLTFTLVLSFTILFFFNRGYVTHNLRQFYFDSVLHQAHSNFYWSSIVEQGKNPFTPNVHPYGSHESNRTFRLTVPLISRFFYLDGIGLYALQVILGFFFLYLLIVILEKILTDKLLIFYGLLGFLNTYVGSCFFLNCFGHCDGFTFFFILCSLLSSNYILLSVSLQLSFWCDERSLIVVLGVLFFHYLYYQLDVKQTLRIFFVLFLNIIFYILVRLYLFNVFQLKSADVESLTIHRFIEIAIDISSWWGAHVYLGTEGFSLVIILVFFILYIERKYVYICSFLVYWFFIILTSFLVADTVRTISFSFVFWLISLILLKGKVKYSQLNLIFYFVAFVNILIPVLFP